MKTLLSLLFLISAAESHAKYTAVQFPTTDGLKLSARVYEPARAGASPAILVVEGSGKSHLDHEPPDDAPFFQLAQKLSDQGYVVLVYSKRGSSGNAHNGSWAKSTFWTDNLDAQSALDFLKARPEVDKSKVFLFGQSIGCLQSSVLAQKNDIKGLIVFAGPYHNLLRILEDQNILIHELMGKTSEQAKQAIAPMMQAYTDIKNGKLNCDKYKDLCHMEDGARIVDDSQEKYMDEVFKFDPVKEMAKVTVPVLVLQGTSDFVISTGEFDYAKETLKGRPNFTFLSLANVDHFMSEQKDKSASLHAMMAAAQSKAIPKLSPKVADVVQDWLKVR